MSDLPDAAAEEAAPKPKVRRISNKPSRKDTGSDPVPNEDGIPPDTDAPRKPDQKRSNRRRRGKGKSGSKDPEQFTGGEAVVEEIISLAPDQPGPLPEIEDKTESRHKPQENRPQQPQKPRRKPDPGKVAKNAWKIFLAEVSEEGVALISDNDARELARRCFRLSEVFLEEEDKRG